jgi:hypothetical protein
MAMLAARVPYTALGAPSPQEKCESAKNEAAGDYARCRQAAEAQRVRNPDTAKYEAALARCEAEIAARFEKAEAVAARKGAECPTTGDVADVDAWIAGRATTIAESLRPGGAVPECGDGEIDVSFEECDEADLSGRTCESFGYESGALACTDGCRFDLAACENPCRFDGGMPANGQCWFINKFPTRESCDTICAAAGRTCDEATTASIALSNTYLQCGVIADLFVNAGNATSGATPECGANAAVGCVVANLGGPVGSGTPLAVIDPAPTCAASGVGTPCPLFDESYRRICACD